jgi:hypothetical protein
VKATGGELDLSYNDQQIRGLIDVADKARNAVSPEALASVTFATTSDTKIPKSTVNYANQHRIQLFQSKAFYDEVRYAYDVGRGRIVRKGTHMLDMSIFGRHIAFVIGRLAGSEYSI